MSATIDACQGWETVAFPAGATVLAEGDCSGCLYVLASGAVEVIKGETPILAVSEPGAIFGEISLLLGVPHPVTVNAITETTCRVKRGDSRTLLENPEFCLRLCEMQARRIRGMIGYLADLKSQYADRSDHLAMVDEVLIQLAHRLPKG